MKSIRQRLQSRISLRRNHIREQEIQLSMWKSVSKTNPHRRQAVSSYRQVIKELADDQKLDRQLYNMVVTEERYARMDEAFIAHIVSQKHAPLFMAEGIPALLEIPVAPEGSNG